MRRRQDDTRILRAEALESLGVTPGAAVESIAAHLRVIRDMSELTHTCFIEWIAPSARSRICWNADAAYVSMDGMAFLMPLLVEVDPDFDYNCFRSMTGRQARGLIERLDALYVQAESAENELDLSDYIDRVYFEDNRQAFERDFPLMRTRLLEFLVEFREVVASACAEAADEDDALLVLGI